MADMFFQFHHMMAQVANLFLHTFDTSSQSAQFLTNVLES